MISRARLLEAMSFLPIAERELRVAARKRGTYWVRIVAAMVAAIVGSGFVAIQEFSGAIRSPMNLGLALFSVLTGLSLAAALLAGVFFTSDTISEEKREGTLGFLFLTDLRGYDVVLGKFVASSLRAFTALLAVFPILAVTLLMGGVTGGHFWRAILALTNAMFVSLAAGLFVSAFSREAQKAFTRTLLILIALLGIGPLCDAAFFDSSTPGFAGLKLSSPLHLFSSAGSSNSKPFWWSLLVNQIIGWTFLGWACWLVPRNWREKDITTHRVRRVVSLSAQSTRALRRRAERTKLMDVSPIFWLTSRDDWPRWLLRRAALLLGVGFAVVCLAPWQTVLWTGWSWALSIFWLFTYLTLAAQSGRLFVSARGQGLMELILTTPLSSREIVDGQWRGLRRTYLAPVAMCMVMQFAGTLMFEESVSMAATPGPPPTPTAITNSSGNTVTITATNSVSYTVRAVGPVIVGRLVPLAEPVMNLLLTLADLVALAWMGMLMGLTSRTTNRAALKTLVFVVLLPWFAITFLTLLLMPLMAFSRVFSATGGSSTWSVWYSLLVSSVSTVLYLAKDVLFVLWSRRRLYKTVRETGRW